MLLQDTDAIITNIARGTRGLIRHELPAGIVVSYVYDGNGDRRGTCQWRVIGPDPDSLRPAVQQLTSSLDRAGVRYDPPRFSETVCHFEDHGPWPLAAKK